MIGYQLHTHLLGVSVQVDLYRGGLAQEVFAYDENYDFNYQETRVFPDPKKLYPVSDKLLHKSSSMVTQEFLLSIIYFSLFVFTSYHLLIHLLIYFIVF